MFEAVPEPFPEPEPLVAFVVTSTGELDCEDEVDGVLGKLVGDLVDLGTIVLLIDLKEDEVISPCT